MILTRRVWLAAALVSCGAAASSAETARMQLNEMDSSLSFVSGVGARSKQVAYGMNRADFSFIAGGIVPGILMVKPDFPEN